MNMQKPIAIVVAILINVIVLAWFHAWSTAVAANAAASAAQTDRVITLPAITVRPTRTQIEMLRSNYKPPATSSIAPAGDGGIQTLVMPYYSFAGESDAERNG